MRDTYPTEEQKGKSNILGMTWTPTRDLTAAERTALWHEYIQWMNSVQQSLCNELGTPTLHCYPYSDGETLEVWEFLPGQEPKRRLDFEEDFKKHQAKAPA